MKIELTDDAIHDLIIRTVEHKGYPTNEERLKAVKNILEKASAGETIDLRDPFKKINAGDVQGEVKINLIDYNIDKTVLSDSIDNSSKLYDFKYPIVDKTKKLNEIINNFSNSSDVACLIEEEFNKMFGIDDLDNLVVEQAKITLGQSIDCNPILFTNQNDLISEFIAAKTGEKQEKNIITNFDNTDNFENKITIKTKTKRKLQNFELLICKAIIEDYVYSKLVGDFSEDQIYHQISFKDSEIAKAIENIILYLNDKKIESF